MHRAPITDSELQQWAKVRADDAGHLARELVAHRKVSGAAIFVGMRCTGCGSSMSDAELAKEKAKRPTLVSCCPERSMVPTYEATSAARQDPALSDENPMRFFAENVDRWGALEWFNRLVDACEDHDRKRTLAFRCTDSDEKDMLSLSADTSKMIMSSSALHLARDHADEIRSALSPQVQDAEDIPQSPWPASDWAIGRIKELEAQAVPIGWKLVPEEPTKEMCEAAPSLPAIHAIDDLPLKKSGWSMSAIVNRKRYRAMLAAAPAKQDIAALETQLQHLITTRPKKAALAALDDDTRMWFVAQLTGTASGSIPITEIEALVARHLPPAVDDTLVN